MPPAIGMFDVKQKVMPCGYEIQHRANGYRNQAKKVENRFVEGMTTAGAFIPSI
jgi:hypothetical protein